VSAPKVGITLPQFGGDTGALLEAAQRAEEAGLDSLWTFDHLWPLSGGKERPILEGWTTLAWLANKTERIGVGTLVTRSSLRHPAILGKMACTVASVAPGRVTLALGSGDDLSRPENEAFGIPYHEGDERTAQLRSTAAVLRKFFSTGVVDHEDQFVTLRGLPVSPMPPTPPSLWIAGRSNPVVEVAGDLADGWNAWRGSVRSFTRDAALLAERAAGRPVELSWGGILMLGRDDDEAILRLGDRDPRGFLVGGPETVATRLNAFVAAGATHLTLTLGGIWRPEDIDILSQEVRPLLG
jgi:alkanesulfonate monooxygenase SsuD/methylene tetrahydromethanopterin reductase-like flavin-dependent oxidoreductase (luciferase family)